MTAWFAVAAWCLSTATGERCVANVLPIWFPDRADCEMATRQVVGAIMANVPDETNLTLIDVQCRTVVRGLT